MFESYLTIGGGKMSRGMKFHRMDVDHGMEAEALQSERHEADFQMAAWDQESRRMLHWESKGICFHNSSAPADKNNIKGPRQCTDKCGKIWATSEEENLDRQSVQEQYL